MKFHFLIILLCLNFNMLFAQSTEKWDFKSTDEIEVTEKKYYEYLKDPQVKRGKLLAEAWHWFHVKVKGKSNENSYMKAKLQEMLSHNIHDYLNFTKNLHYSHTKFMMKQLEPGQLNVIRELYTKKLFSKTNVPSNLPKNGEGWLAYKKRNKNATVTSKPKPTKKPVGWAPTKKTTKQVPKKIYRCECFACNKTGKIKRRVWVIRTRERRAGNMGYGKNVVVNTTYAEYLRGDPKPMVGGNTTAKVEDVMMTCY